MPLFLLLSFCFENIFIVSKPSTLLLQNHKLSETLLTCKIQLIAFFRSNTVFHFYKRKSFNSKQAQKMDVNSEPCKNKQEPNIYLLKVINRNASKRCEICSKLTIKTPRRTCQS